MYQIHPSGLEIGPQFARIIVFTGQNQATQRVLIRGDLEQGEDLVPRRTQL